MSAAVLILAVALLVDPGPTSARRRAGLVVRTGAGPNRNRGGVDPFANASALDVLAVCLDAGMSVAGAAAATAASAEPGLRVVLRRAADLLALGADPDTVWSVHGRDGELEALMRLARRSAASGSALARGVAELADQLRQDAVHAATGAAERAGVLIAGPLGLCFLPAFVCLGIVPVVAGLASDVLKSGIL